MLALIAVSAGWYAAADQAEDWARRVYAVCEAYDGLDLSALAPLCADAGYQELLTLTDEMAPPAVLTVMPEDAGRLPPAAGVLTTPASPYPHGGG